MYWMFIGSFFMGRKAGEGCGYALDRNGSSLSLFLKIPDLFLWRRCSKGRFYKNMLGNVILGDIGIVGGLLS